ncbi:argininosuccinate lyase [Candidatus Bathyarchaeota archaeon RBG_16_48_13]|nr:MAG: argininosuccinate lyase [Candidatus Bathyarchaeota archaeon RBG_16_48_13]
MSGDLLRDGLLGPRSESIAKFTSSIKDDTYLAKGVIDINKAHIVMLANKRILSKSEGAALLEALNKVDLTNMDPKLEDIHMNLEQKVVQIIGEEVGGRMHTGKSRNDQVATAIRICLRNFVIDLMSSLIKLRETILNRCEECLYTVMPGYTHLQRAQPVTLAHQLMAHYDSQERNWARLKDAYKRLNLSPMGAAALATTSFDIDRYEVSDLLGFDGIVENSIDAVSSRDFAAEILFVLAQTMADLSSVSEELVIWATSEFNIVKLPDQYVSTSSIMPQKKNPVTAELIRAKTGSVYGSLIAFLTILKALPLSYNIDLQEATQHLWLSCEATLSSIVVMEGLLKEVKFDSEKLLSEAKEDLSTATDLADTLVRDFGLPFRVAYRIVRTVVKELATSDWDARKVSVLISNETDGKILLTPERISAILDPISSVKNKKVVGGPSPTEVGKSLKKRRKGLEKDTNWLERRTRDLGEASSRLEAACINIKLPTRRS